MGALFIAIIFWLIGIVLIISERYLIAKMRHVDHELEKEAEALKFQDNSASMVLTIEEKVLDLIPWFSVRLVTLVIGMILIVFGFVALGFMFD